MPDVSVNWTEDKWFSKYHAKNVTDEFKAWWVGYYGVPGDYGDSEGATHEYWKRCAFAWMGWEAARK